MHQSSEPVTVLFEGRYLQMIRKDGWEYVQRRGSTGVVGIVAVTEENTLLIVEQYRIPIGRRSLELPAGLSGDLADAADEELAEAARRELLEETGYEAQMMMFLARGPSSAGLTDETLTLFRAGGLKKVGSGGGDHTEDITVHEVPVPHAFAWLEHRAADGTYIDFKVWAALAFCQNQS